MDWQAIWDWIWAERAWLGPVLVTVALAVIGQFFGFFRWLFKLIPRRPTISSTPTQQPLAGQPEKKEIQVGELHGNLIINEAPKFTSSPTPSRSNEIEEARKALVKIKDEKKKEIEMAEIYIEVTEKALAELEKTRK